jgi:uncharacterized protein (DUF58 family)
LSATGWAAGLLILVGALAGAGGLVLAGALVGLVVVLRSLWSRYGLRALSYERHLASDRVVWGERLKMELVVRNAKLLPLPWLHIEDLVSHGAVVDRHPLERSEQPGLDILHGTWSVGWFERVTRPLQIVGTHRGIYRFVSARMKVADLFAPAARTEERPMPGTYRVVPRIVPVRAAETQSPIVGASRAKRGLYEDASLFAGVRPYQAGDHVRRIHWKATARLGRPVSRRYDPVREREVVLAVDMQTLPGPYWQMVFDEDLVEGLCVTALSLARSLIDDGVAVGLAVNAFSNRPQRTVFLPPSAAPSQVATAADLLAAISPFASLGFSALLASLAGRAPLGCAIVALSARDPMSFLPHVRRLGALGYLASHAALGPGAARWTARAHAVGVPSSHYALAPDWRTADALERVA